MYTKINAIANNAYYTYSAACNLVTFPKRVHTTFTVVSMLTSFDFFPAIKRLQDEFRTFTQSITLIDKLQYAAHTIAEAASMCVDVITVIEGLKTFKLLSSALIPWSATAYKILAPFQPLWLPGNIHKTYCNCLQKKFTKELAIEIVDTMSNIIYYSTYLLKPTPTLHCIQVACCISTLTLSFFQ